MIPKLPDLEGSLINIHVVMIMDFWGHGNLRPAKTSIAILWFCLIKGDAMNTHGPNKQASQTNRGKKLKNRPKLLLRKPGLFAAKQTPADRNQRPPNVLPVSDDQFVKAGENSGAAVASAFGRVILSLARRRHSPLATRTPERRHEKPTLYKKERWPSRTRPTCGSSSASAP